MLVAQRQLYVPPASVRPGITIIDPADLSVVFSGTDAVLSWSSSPSSGVTTYDIYRRSPPTGAPFVPGVDTPVATAVTSPYTDPGLTAGQYEWQVFGNIPWLPSSLGTLLAWQDPSVASSITSSGSAVSNLADITGHGWDMVQSSGAAKPITGSANINGLNAISFDGIAQFLEMASNFNQASPYTIFMVFRMGSTSGTQVIYGEIQADVRVASSLFEIQNGGGAQSTTVSADTSAHALMAQFNGASSQSQVDATTAGPFVTIDTNSLRRAALGVQGVSDSNFAKVDVGEIFIDAAATSSGDIASAMAYLKTKWGTP